jgi:hypothetical protein
MRSSGHSQSSRSAKAYDGFFICRICSYLVEKDAPEGMGQLCRCNDRDQQQRWEGFDFNERAALCLCCAQEVLESGSRWSPYFCRECQLLAMGASIWQGRLVMPIGRHTLMHTWVPKDIATSPDGPSRPVDEPDEVLATLQSIGGRLAHLSRWYQATVARNLTVLGIQGDVSLRGYLEAIASAQDTGIASPGRFDLFRGLCEHFQLFEAGSRGVDG